MTSGKPAANDTVPFDVVDRAVEALLQSTRTTSVPTGLAERAIALQAADSATVLPEPAAQVRVPARSWRLPRLVSIAASLGLLAVMGALAVGYLGRPTSAFAEVVDTLRRAVTVSYTKHDRRGGTARVVEHGSVLRTEHDDGTISILNYGTGKAVELNPKEKTAVLGTVDPDAMPDIGSLLSFCREKLNAQDGKLVGRARIGEIDAEQYTSVRDGMAFQIWVNPATRLPLKMEIKGPEWLAAKHRFTNTFEDFDWSPQVNPAAMRVEVPADYREETSQSIEIGVMTKDKLAALLRQRTNMSDFLRLHVDTFGGRFPDKLDRLDLDFQGDGQQLKKFQTQLETTWKAMLDFRSALDFAGRKLHYLGQGRMFRDGKGIVVWWPTCEGRCVAVYDDLSIKEVNESELPKGGE
jgi:hypothetical protein